ncbi:MAG TPA: hypothetical protein VNX21_00645 [Candidatus Thermoplasmatota archaeon]|nr:hypothetical protein [Candidatus Thermoplasmatota archaeon]
MGQDEDVMLKAFSSLWLQWRPRRLYTPIEEKSLLEAANLPADRAKAALVNLMNGGLLVRRGAIRARTELGWMYQFTVEGARAALAKDYISPGDAPPLPTSSP